VVMLDFDDPIALTMGDRVRVRGVSNGRVGSARGTPFRARVTVRDYVFLSRTGSAPLAAGNRIRARVMDQLEPFDDGRALLAGFPVGDTTQLDRSGVEAMRPSWLCHFVAVGGSNVALSLIFLAVVAGPLAIGPQRRALVGLM